MISPNGAKSTRNQKSGFEQFKTHIFNDKRMLQNNYVDHSSSFNSRSNIHRSISAKSCRSTEPQSRNPSHQIPLHKPTQKSSERICEYTNANPAFLELKKPYKKCQNNPKLSSSYSRSHRASSSELLHKLEQEYQKQHVLENTIEEYMVSNRKLQTCLKQSQQK